MGRPKALLEYDGRTFLDRLVWLCGPHCESIVVVVGHHAGAIRAAVALPPNARFAGNPDPDRGMLSSLQTGLAALPAGSDFLFTPVDLPAVAPATVARLCAAFHKSAPPIVIPRHAGRRGHPVLCGGPLASEFLELPDDAQARDVIEAHAGDILYVEVDDAGVVTDIDHPEDYRRLLAPSA
jgi:molybdenum cofactor cytidylyltransferase